MKSIYIFIVVLFSTLIISCSAKDDITAFAVVHFDSGISEKETGRVILGNNRYTGKAPGAWNVYHYNKRKNTIQIQPSKTGNTINNINAKWNKIESIESLDFYNVYYREDNGSYFSPNFKLINDEKVEVFKVIVHKYNSFSDVINIYEYYFIEVDSINAFKFDYTLEELK